MQTAERPGEPFPPHKIQPSWLAEFVLERILAIDRKGLFQRMSGAFFFSFRGKLARLHLFVRYRLAGKELVLPLEHDLPLIRKAHPQYSANLGRICAHLGRKYPRFPMIDIGANVGDSVAIVRERSDCPILCVEGNRFYFDILAENLRRGGYPSVQSVNVFVATHTGELKGEVVSTSGTAHLVEVGDSTLQVERLKDILTRFPDFENPGLLKIDTDGLDCSILRAELEWLAERAPAIFFEYDPFFFRKHPYDGSRVFDDLAAVGYERGIFFDNVGDYLVSLDIQRERHILRDLQNYYLDRGGHSYLDVLLLHRRDSDLADEIREAEIRWSFETRKGQLPPGRV